MKARWIRNAKQKEAVQYLEQPSRQGLQRLIVNVTWCKVQLHHALRALNALNVLPLSSQVSSVRYYWSQDIFWPTMQASKRRVAERLDSGLLARIRIGARVTGSCTGYRQSEPTSCGGGMLNLDCFDGDWSKSGKTAAIIALKNLELSALRVRSTPRMLGRLSMIEWLQCNTEKCR